MAEINKPDNLNIIWADLGEKREPSQAKIQQGWVAEIPTYQDFNWLDGRQDQFIAHINQRGIPEWDANTEYQAGKSYVQSSNGNLHFCINTNTGNNPLLDTTKTNWITYDQEELINFSYLNSYTDGIYPLKISIKGGCIVLNGVVNAPSSITSNVITNLPEIYRPRTTQVISACQIAGSTPSPLFLQISSVTGNVSVWGESPVIQANSIVYINGSGII